jgi:hypothetical protein
MAVTREMLDAGEAQVKRGIATSVPFRTIARDVYTAMAAIPRPVGRPKYDPETCNLILSDLRSGLSVRQIQTKRHASAYIINKMKSKI